ASATSAAAGVGAAAAGAGAAAAGAGAAGSAAAVGATIAAHPAFILAGVGFGAYSATRWIDQKTGFGDWAVNLLVEANEAAESSRAVSAGVPDDELPKEGAGGGQGDGQAGEDPVAGTPATGDAEMPPPDGPITPN